MSVPAPPIALVSRQERQKEGIVAILETMLEAAKRGEYLSLMAVTELEDQSIMWHWSGSDDLPALAGKLDLLKHQVYRRLFRDTPLAQ